MKSDFQKACGCWVCGNCSGIGKELDSSSPDEGEECEGCNGNGITKTCPKHTEGADWRKNK